MNRLRIALTAGVLAFPMGIAWAGKVPESPEELQAHSKAIVLGVVEEYATEDVDEADGSKTRYVDLKVVVATVEKAVDGVEEGAMITVRCWRVIREPRTGVLWDSGDDYIPGPGGMSRFFLSGESNGRWSPIYPNGIEALDGKASLTFPWEPRAKGWVAWPGILYPVGAGVILAVLIVSAWLLQKRTKRKQVGQMTDV